MPDSVAQRLDTVLAAEVAQRNAAGRAAARGEAAPADQAERAGGDGTRESPAPRRPGGNRGFRRLALRVLAPAAAVVVLAAGGYGLTRINLGSSTGSAASTTAGGAVRSAPSVAAGAESAGHVNAPAAGPSRAAAVPRGIARAGFSLVAGQRNLTRANLAQQVRVELLVPASARRTQTPTQQLRGCVAKLADGRTVELVESVHFEGRPATLVVARTGAEDTAWIAAPDCSDTYRHVLATTTLPPGISGP
jgi:acetolactate synthase regulatory subunit